MLAVQQIEVQQVQTVLGGDGTDEGMQRLQSEQIARIAEQVVPVTITA